ncbi:chitin elicitor receptor kinase 1-like protein [Tanacetum coccineum]|uniref:Chitin elicitor receptor kinase 1-like protein n=1 Tax=Tanacetum coccineum TaxID=301880 RepID=A0ABQ5DKQ3_9ASTR
MNFKLPDNQGACQTLLCKSKRGGIKNTYPNDILARYDLNRKPLGLDKEARMVAYCNARKVELSFRFHSADRCRTNLKDFDVVYTHIQVELSHKDAELRLLEIRNNYIYQCITKGRLLLPPDDLLPLFIVLHFSKSTDILYLCYLVVVQAGLSGGQRAGISIGAVAGVLLFCTCFYLILYRRKRVAERSLLDEIGIEHVHESGPLIGGTQPGITCITVDKSVEFTYDELAKATDDSSLANKIGQGGFGAVYYAELRGEVVFIDVHRLLHVNQTNLNNLLNHLDNSSYTMYSKNQRLWLLITYKPKWMNTKTLDFLSRETDLALVLKSVEGCHKEDLMQASKEYLAELKGQVLFMKDIEFGKLQASDMWKHLWTRPISNASVEFVQVGASVEVRANRVTKV